MNNRTHSRFTTITPRIERPGHTRPSRCKSWLASYRNHAAHIGHFNLLLLIIYKSINRLMVLKIYNLIVLTAETVCSDLIELPEHFTIRRVNSNELSGYKIDDDIMIDRKFIEEVSRKNDVIHGIFHGRKMVGFSCNSSRPTCLFNNLQISFSDRYIYSYRAIVAKAYRGQRLNSLMTINKFNHFLAQGYTGMIACVEKVNFSSMKSINKIGYRIQGRLVVVGLFGKYMIYLSKSCHRFGICVIHQPSQ